MLGTKKGTITILMMIGIVFSFSIGTVCITGFDVLDSFYNNGAVFDMPQSVSYSFIAEGGYSDIDRNWVVKEADFAKWIDFEKFPKTYDYLLVEVSDLTGEMLWIVDYADPTIELPVLARENYTLKNGVTQLELPSVKFSMIGIRIVNQQGLTFKINSMQLREQPIIPNFTSRMIKNVAFFTTIYSVVIAILLYIAKKLKWKLDFTKPITCLQWLYIKVGNTALKAVNIIPIKVRKILITSLWLAIIIFFNLRNLRVPINPTSTQRIITLNIILLCIAILSLRIKLKYVGWNNMLVKAWLIFSVMTIISDIVVKKAIMHQGIIMILVLGFLTFVWNNMERPAAMIEPFINAVHIYFVAVTVFCLICRPDIFPRYLGAFANPVTFGIYSALMAVVALVCLDNLIDKGKLGKASLFYVIEFCISIIFVWKTGSRTALFPVAIIIGLALLRHIIAWKRQGNNKIFLQTLLIMLLLAGPITLAMNWGLGNLPQILNTKVSFAEDIYEEETVQIESTKYEDIKTKSAKPVPANAEQANNIQRLSINALLVNAGHQEKKEATISNNFIALSADQTNNFSTNRIWDKFISGSLEDFTSGRTLIWKAYLREMNLFGHSRNAEVFGRRTNAHSALVTIPYSYGVFTIIPYILMLVLVLKKSFSYMYNGPHNHKREYALLPLAITIIFFSAALVDVAEYLYSSLIWVLFYWMMGFFFVKND